MHVFLCVGYTANVPAFVCLSLETIILKLESNLTCIDYVALMLGITILALMLGITIPKAL